MMKKRKNPCDLVWQLGLNMHPKWLGDGTAEEFLLPLSEIGLSVLEFTLDLSSSDWPAMHLLIEECRQLGFQLSFHAPYKGPYNPVGFSTGERDKIERLYGPAIGYAARVAEETGPSTLVVHGAKGNYPRGELLQDTKAFLGWILEVAPCLCPSIELLVRDENRCKIGDNYGDLVTLVPALGSSRIGICWDLGHDARNGSLPLPPGFIASVHHVHVHDIAPDGRDHCPLLFGNVPYEMRLRQLAGVGYRKAVILEVNGYYVSHFAAREDKRPSQMLQSSLRKLGQSK